MCSMDYSNHDRRVDYEKIILWRLLMMKQLMFLNANIALCLGEHDLPDRWERIANRVKAKYGEYVIQNNNYQYYIYNIKAIIEAIGIPLSDKYASIRAKVTEIKGALGNYDDELIVFLGQLEHDLCHLEPYNRAEGDLSKYSEEISVLASQLGYDHERISVLTDVSMDINELNERIKQLKNDVANTGKILQMARKLKVSSSVDKLILVEDEPRWSDPIEIGVLIPLRNDYSIDFKMFRTKKSVQDWLVDQENNSNLHRALLICDLSIPNEEGEEAHLKNGWGLIREYISKLPIIVITTYDHVYEELIQLGQPELDFVVKGGIEDDEQDWITTLNNRVRVHFGLRMDDCVMKVLNYSGNTIMFNNIEVELKPIEFAIIEALASKDDTSWKPVFPQDLIERVLRVIPEKVGDEKESIRDFITYNIHRHVNGEKRINTDELIKRIALHGHSSLDLRNWRGPEAVKGRVTEHLNRALKKIEKSALTAGYNIPKDKLYDIQNIEGKDVDYNYKLIPKSITLNSPILSFNYMDELTNLGGFNILVVEDTDEWRELVVNALRLYGFESTYYASTRDEAMEKTKERNYDLVVLDLKIPRRAGEAPSINHGLYIAKNISYPLTQFIVFSIYDQKFTRAKVSRSIMASLTDFDLDYDNPFRFRKYIRKSLEDREHSVASVVTESSRAYIDSRRCMWSTGLEGKDIHTIIIPHFDWPPNDETAIPDYFYIDDKKLIYPTGGQHTRPVRRVAAILLNIFAQYANIPLHARWLINQLYDLDALSVCFGIEIGNIPSRVRLTRALSTINTAIENGGFDPGTILKKTGDDTYKLIGLIRYEI